MIRILFKNILYILFFLLISTSLVSSKIKSEIVLKVDEYIITSIDIENEKKFLIFLNQNLNNVSEELLNNISLDSLKNRKIKEIELKKFYNLDDASLGAAFVGKFIKNSEFNNKENLINELNRIDLAYDYFENNFKIDNTWREFIYTKFKSQVKINTDELKKQVSIQKSEVEELNLSEILFRNVPNKSIEEHTKDIYSEIKNSGFEVAASIFSISESKKFGGKLGWIRSSQISKLIYSKIELDTKITPPIETANGYLILKVNDRRKIDKKINFEEELEKLINKEMQVELNKLGYIYFNKIKKKTFISEK